MFDQSGSMCSCIDPSRARAVRTQRAAKRAWTPFERLRSSSCTIHRAPASASGLGYFGKQPIGQASCRESDYEAPGVVIGTLPEHASTLMNALNQVEPTGETPTGAAIAGACTYASNHKQNAPTTRW